MKDDWNANFLIFFRENENSSQNGLAFYQCNFDHFFRKDDQFSSLFILQSINCSFEYCRFFQINILMGNLIIFQDSSLKNAFLLHDCLIRSLILNDNLLFLIGAYNISILNTIFSNLTTKGKNHFLKLLKFYLKIQS